MRAERPKSDPRGEGRVIELQESSQKEKKMANLPDPVLLLLLLPNAEPPKLEGWLFDPNPPPAPKPKDILSVRRIGNYGSMRKLAKRGRRKRRISSSAMRVRSRKRARRRKEVRERRDRNKLKF